MRIHSFGFAIVIAASLGSGAGLLAQQQPPAAGQAPPQGGRQGGQGAAGQGGGGVRGGRGAAPQTPAPRNAQGRVLLGGKGVWTPSGFGITTPLLAKDKTPYQPWAAALYEYRQTNELEPHTRCKPSGFSRQFMTPYGVEFVELPDQKQIYIFDIGGPHTFRTIYMDGRSHPASGPPTAYGHSIGWWEGDTLVSDTTNFHEGFWLDRKGLPHTEQLHTIERWTRKDYATMEYSLTVDDPGAYTAPWTTSVVLTWEANTELFEYVCQQQNYAHELMVGEMKTVNRTTVTVP